VSNYRRFHVVSSAIVCLAFTGAGVAWADPADLYVPVAPRADDGATVRVGTAVGFIYGGPSNVLALGGTAAIGQRFGRLGIEAEYTILSLLGHETVVTDIGSEDTDVSIGHAQRLNAMARFDLIRFGPRVDKTRSLITFYVEGGAGVAYDHWSKSSFNEDQRLVPVDSKRAEGQAGFGLMIFPHRVAWLIGWRLAVSPHQPMQMVECRSTTICSQVPMMDSGGVVDDSMLFQSSLEFTF